MDVLFKTKIGNRKRDKVGRLDHHIRVSPYALAKVLSYN